MLRREIFTGGIRQSVHALIHPPDDELNRRTLILNIKDIFAHPIIAGIHDINLTHGAFGLAPGDGRLG